MTVAAGTRVSVRMRLLEPSDRAPALPADTAALPFEAAVPGLLVEPARVGGPATVRTAAGRLVTGSLDEIEPADTHGFGRPVTALAAVDLAISQLAESLD